ncbi:MAG: helix-turn-helix domain-containing protein [Burkholderiaceae bacterium]
MTIKPPPPPPSSPPPPLRIAILAYEGCMATEIFGLSDVLLIASHMDRALGRGLNPSGLASQPFDVQVVGLKGRSVNVAGGVSVGILRPVGRYDLLIVPGPEISRRDEWGGKLARLSPELAFIRKAFAAGTPVASVCVGAFLLGEAGLLAGRRATTAWLFSKELALRYPQAQVQADAVLVEDGAVITTGAVTSAFDLAIHLVKRSLGAQVAAATARVALLSNQRASQAPYVDQALMDRRLPSFSQSVAQWLADRLTDPYDLALLATAFHVSVRTLLRRVNAETGHAPLLLLQTARIEKAKQLLTRSTWSIARVTQDVGYTDVVSFTRLFVSQVGETPAKYRRRQ